MKGESAGLFTIGVGLGGLIGFFIALLLTPLFGADSFGAFVHNYQDLIGAFVTLVAGLLAVWGILRQIREAQIIDEQERERHRQGARTLMPAALSEISSYASELLKALYRIRPPRNTPLDSTLTTPPKYIQRLKAVVPPPRDVVLDLKECVLSAPDDVQKAISDLVIQLQIQRSRTRSLAEALEGAAMFPLETTPRLIDERMADILRLYASASSLFDYARRRSEHPEDRDLVGAAMNHAIDDGEFPNLYSLLSEQGEVRGGEEAYDWTIEELLESERH